MRLCPVHDLAGARDRLPLVQSQHRNADLPGQLLDLLAALATLAPGPRREPIAGHLAKLVLIAGVVERLGRPPTRVPQGGKRFLLPARVKDHGASLSSRAITSGTCTR